MTTTLSPITPDWLPGAPPSNKPDRQQVGRCAIDPNPDRWVDLPPIRNRGRVNPDYAERVIELGRTCAICPIQSTCAWDALRTDVSGVWAGTDEFTRHDLRQALELPTPKPLTFGTVTAAEPTDTDRLRFAARYLAAKTDLTLAAIAERLGVSAMTVTRFLDDRDPDTIPKRATTST